MLNIKGIERLKGIGWGMKVCTNEGGIELKFWRCEEVDRVEDGFDKPIGYYTFDLNIEIGEPLVIWFDRNYNEEKMGYRVSNNLVDGEAFFNKIDVTTFERFVDKLSDYFHSIKDKIEYD